MGEITEYLNHHIYVLLTCNPRNIILSGGMLSVLLFYFSIHITDNITKGINKEMTLIDADQKLFRCSVNVSNTEPTLNQAACKITSQYKPYPEAEEVDTTYPIDNTTLRILFWTSWLHGDWWYLPTTSLVNCGGVKCQYTHDKSLYGVSHALLFFFNQVAYRKKNIKSFHPRHRIPKQYWIAQFHGPPTFIFRFSRMFQMKNIFNLSSSYHHKADVRTVHGKCNKAIESETIQSNYATGKKGLVSWFVSHCVTPNRRESYVKELTEYIPVNVYGGCDDLNSQGTLCKNSRENHQNCDDARDTMNSYKFYLAFENSNCVDYITEKVYKVLEPHMTTVPIIMSGESNLEQLLPPKSYINVNSFSSVKELASYLLELDKNDKLYNEYFAWRSSYTCVLNWWPCSFCRAFHENYGREHTLLTDLLPVFGRENCENAIRNNE